uniref:Uncharacterized protein n=1 Tax=Aegilops tauschii TaxID=37682 RepID=M8C0X6_AEGTA
MPDGVRGSCSGPQDVTERSSPAAVVRTEDRSCSGSGGGRARVRMALRVRGTGEQRARGGVGRGSRGGGRRVAGAARSGNASIFFECQEYVF